MLENNTILGSTLVEMYAKCGELVKAAQVFVKFQVQDVVAWTALMAGYTRQEQGEKALKCFDSMQSEGHSPDAITFIWALKACGGMGALAKGEQIHDMLISSRMLETNIMLGNTLVDMYDRCGVLSKAKQVLNELPVCNAVTWNALIAGYAQHGQGKEALRCFDRMQCQGYPPDDVTFTCALKACGSIGAVAKAQEIHEKIFKLGMLEKAVVLGNTLVDMYARCDALAKAQQAFGQLPMWDVVGWTALIAGYAQQGDGKEALECFDNMQCEGRSPDAVTFMSALKACGSIGGATKGQQLHDQLVSLGLLEDDTALGNAFLAMYARCDALSNAEQVFDQLTVQDVISWTALIAAYAQQGQCEVVFKDFERMQSKRVKPGSATLVCVLNACCHSGLLDLAEMYFLKLTVEYGITLDLEHCRCMIDVFGHAGKLDRALLEIEMLTSDHLLCCFTLLGACLKWGDVKIGRLAFQHALCLDKNNAAAYVSIANIRTVAGIQMIVDLD